MWSSRTAFCRLTGIFTRPKLMDPFQTLPGMATLLMFGKGKPRSLHDNQKPGRENVVNFVQGRLDRSLLSLSVIPSRIRK
jgi:hypothetical protein